MGNEPNDKADILNRQYESVFTHENQEHVPSPPGTPLPSMSEICVTEAVWRSCCAKSIHGRLQDLTVYLAVS
ncbi:hypothetical protein DPMN_058457 [Dreissena polymorpha]|uniref:Uncharacterized protein n=1 Tax=Dreissena polymorpha TaxID=45954 RepID=A0A9D4HDN7_DREPO|nr:hypothetical protein DPMN_058457 [Dreissena polymorpha]